MSDFVSLLMIGGVLGWLVSVLSRADAQQSILLNIVAGSVGSYLGSVLIGPLLRAGATGHWLAAVAGAAVLLAAIGLARRARML